MEARPSRLRRAIELAYARPLTLPAHRGAKPFRHPGKLHDAILVGTLAILAAGTFLT